MQRMNQPDPSPSPNWVHLDLKGIIPNQPKLMEWVSFLADCGFDAVVWEFEDRLPWQIWPGTHRPGYGLDAWHEIWAHATSSGLANVPLIQTHGHLEWLLQHDDYEHWREAGHISELCPSQPGVRPALKQWIDEIAQLMPEAKHIVLGGDETWRLGTCTTCRARASSHPEGKAGLYLEHLSSVCKHAVHRGLRPMIWGDVLVRENCANYAAYLPPETVLIDWQYDTITDSLARVDSAKTGYDIWGASAIRCNFNGYDLVGHLGDRLTNIKAWQQRLREGRVAGLIHTTWGRSTAVRPPYGPWEGWAPLFRVAGDPASDMSPDMLVAIERVDEVMCRPSPTARSAVQDMLATMIDKTSPSRFERDALCWWGIALRYQAAIHATLINGFGLVSAISAPPPVDNHDWRDELRTNCSVVRGWIDDLEQTLNDYWDRCALGDREEYITSRLSCLRAAVGLAIEKDSASGGRTEATA